MAGSDSVVRVVLHGTNFTQTVIDSSDAFAVISNKADQLLLDSKYQVELLIVTNIGGGEAANETEVLLQTVSLGELLGYFLTENCT